MRKTSVILICAIILTLSLASVFAFALFRKPKQTTAALPVTFQVVALGTITPGEAIMQITAPASSGETRITRLLVRENDAVAARQILAVLDSEPRLRAALADALTQYAARQADLGKTLAGNSTFEIAAQRATVGRDIADTAQKNTDFKRYDELYQTGVVSRQDWEARQLTLRTSENDLHNAQEILKQDSEVRLVDVAVSRAALRSAGSTIEQANVNLEQAYVRAPIAGDILKIHTWPGERIGDSGLLDLAPSEITYAITEVYETDLGRIRIGQSAEVASSALPHPLFGTVARISRNVERQQTVNTDPAANTDARIVRVYVAINHDSVQLARQWSNLQVTVRFQ